MDKSNFTNKLVKQLLFMTAHLNQEIKQSFSFKSFPSQKLLKPKVKDSFQSWSCLWTSIY